MKKIAKEWQWLESFMGNITCKGNVKYVHGGSNEAATAGPSNGALWCKDLGEMMQINS